MNDTNSRLARSCARFFGMLLCGAMLALHYSEPMRQVRELPARMHTADGALPQQAKTEVEWLSLDSDGAAAPVFFSGDERLDAASSSIRETREYRLFGVIPVRRVTVERTESVRLTPGGMAVGITIRTRGVLVVGLGAVETEAGALSPGTAAGLQAGDVILSVNGIAVKNGAHLAALANATEGALLLTVEREGEQMELSLLPVRDVGDGAQRIGLWVRDSTAGVGTISFYDARSEWFAALGHPVSDIDTQSLLSVREGRIIGTEIIDVRKGEQGSPGELIGVFAVSDRPMGEILLNSELGIYGKISELPGDSLLGEIPMGFAYEAHEGPAQMLATVSQEGVTAFDCEVIRINSQSNAATKGMIVDITDERLLAATGGIVQGMSGAPVVQDGKLIGVVTHVFVNDPTRGYCVYAEWMYERMKSAVS